MHGFESYIPSRWLDGVLSIHISAPPISKGKLVVRAGRWASKRVMAAAVAAGAICAAVVAVEPASIADPRQHFHDLVDVGRQGEYAPSGYFEKLTAAIELARRLPAQAIDRDPPVLV